MTGLNLDPGPLFFLTILPRPELMCLSFVGCCVPCKPCPFVPTRPEFQAEALCSANYSKVFGVVPADYWNKMEASTGFKPLREGALPILLYGDECVCQHVNWMVLTWQSEVSPCPQDSIFSRHLVTIIPSTSYVVDERTKVNAIHYKKLCAFLSALCHKWLQKVS